MNAVLQIGAAMANSGKKANRSKATRAPRARKVPSVVKMEDRIVGLLKLRSKIDRFVEVLEREKMLIAKEKGCDPKSVAWGEALRRCKKSGSMNINSRDDAQYPDDLLAYGEKYHLEVESESNRMVLGVCFGQLARGLVQRQMTPEGILQLACEQRTFDTPSEVLLELKAIQNGRGSVFEKTRRAYNELARDSIAFPLPDTRRGKRGELGKLISFYSRPIEPKRNCD